MKAPLSPRKITKVLIANRGEIALRVIRTCRDLGIQSVAVFSDPDRQSLHVTLADEAYPLAGSESKDTYLNMAKLVEIAQQSGAQAVHPGYGFLSENADFSALCEKYGLIFLGPTAATIDAMGDKISARTLARQAQVPTVPGTDSITNDQQGLADAKKIGFPVLIKCSAGGGGHGMRLVEKENDFLSALPLCRSEGKKAFGDDTVYLEKFVTHPRHIEVQIFGFGDGDAVAFGTRCCSVQRRHQKVIEEAPAPALTPATLSKLCGSAESLAKNIAYRGAGTLEFIVDDQENFYFLEMNTRLQVEHTVTEMIYNIDLVAAQIGLMQDAVTTKQWLKEVVAKGPRGHAFECRLYAESPLNNFLPAPGKIERLRFASGPWVRVDSAIEEGQQIPREYDPMIAKLITWGTDREQARQRMLRALRETVLAGVESNLGFLTVTLENATFVSGNYSTHLISQEGLVEKLRGQSEEFIHLRASQDALIVAAEKILTTRNREERILCLPMSSWQTSSFPNRPKR